MSFRRCATRQFEASFHPLSVEDKVEGMSFRQALRTAAPETDRVTSRERVNPAGDALLLNFIDKVPRDLLRMTWAGIKRWVTHGDGAPAGLREAAAGYTIGQQAPLDIKPLMQTLHAVMAEFPKLTPHLGQEHTWSPQSRDYQGFGYWNRLGLAILGERSLPMPTLRGSKLLWSLGIGVTNVIMPTGGEAALKSWILEQKPGSVELHALFRQAYRLNRGDLYATLLCAENVLAEGLYDPNRGEREVSKRLSYLRSDSAPAGDNFASWYHLMGSALYSLMRTPQRARQAMKIESAGSFLLEGKDLQEDYINKLGVELGMELRKAVEQGLDKGAVPIPYVNTREFGWSRRAVGAWTVGPASAGRAP
jgi:hypothetical protein